MADEDLKPMIQMSQAIMHILNKYGKTIPDLTDDVLMDFAIIVPAFGNDFITEAKRRGLYG